MLVVAMEDENRFCVACGATLPEGARYCIECGAPVGGRVNLYRAGPGLLYAAKSRNGPDMKMFILIYSVVAALMGILLLWVGLSLEEATWNEVSNLYEDMGMGSLTPWNDSMPMTIIIPGAFTLLSGLCALGSWWLCRQHGPKKMAVLACALSTVLILNVGDLVGVVLCIVGAFVTYRLYIDKYSFTS